MSTDQPVVTFDLFSALIDSRTGAGTAFGRLAVERGWKVDGETLYERWDALTKQAHRDVREWVPHVELARDALAASYRDLGLTADADEDVRAVHDTLPDWPLWPGVQQGLPEIAAHYRIGVLSNVDDALFARTRAAPLVDPELLMSSERLRAYKPDARIYARAQERLGGLVHVATSARDVRGALEAGIPVVRLRRPGYSLDPDGPPPQHEVDDLGELAVLLHERRVRAPRPSDPTSEPE